MTKGPSPLLGFNNNVRHKGKLFHIQTEDSGVRHPHVITHLFTDGGRIIKTTKTAYAEHLGAENMAAIVRQLMKEQHKAMFVALRDGLFDPAIDRPLVDRLSVVPPSLGTPPLASVAPLVVVDPLAPTQVPSALPPASLPPSLPAGMTRAPVSLGRPPGPPPLPSADRRQPASSSESHKAVAVPHPSSFAPSSSRRPEKRASFGDDLISEKSLDEVILSYLAEDLELPDPGKKK